MHSPGLDIDRLTPTQEGASEMIEESHQKELEEDCQAEQLEQGTMLKQGNENRKRKSNDRWWRYIVKKNKADESTLTEKELEELKRVKYVKKSNRYRMNKECDRIKEALKKIKKMKEEGCMKAVEDLEKKAANLDSEDLEKKAANLYSELRNMSKSLHDVKEEILLIEDTMLKKKKCLCKEIVEKSKQSGALLTEKELNELKLALRDMRVIKSRMNKELKQMTEEAKHRKEEEGRMDEDELREKKAANLDSELRKLSKSLDDVKEEMLLIEDTMWKKKKCLWKEIVEKSKQSVALLTEKELKELKRALREMGVMKSRMNKELKQMTEEAKLLKEEEGRMEEAELREKKAANLDSELRKLSKSLDDVKEEMRMISDILPKKNKGSKLSKEWKGKRGYMWWRDIVQENKELLTEKKIAELNRVLSVMNTRHYRMNKELKKMTEGAKKLEEEKRTKEEGRMEEVKELEKKAEHFNCVLRNLNKELELLKTNRAIIVDTIKLNRMKKKLNQMKEGKAREKKAVELEAIIQNTRAKVEQWISTSDPEMNAGMSGVNQMGENLNEESNHLEQDSLLIVDILSKKRGDHGNRKRNYMWLMDIVKKNKEVLTEDELENLNRASRSLKTRKYRMNKEFKKMTEEANHLKKEEEQMKADGRMEDAKARGEKAEELDCVLRHVKKEWDLVKQEWRFIGDIIKLKLMGGKFLGKKVTELEAIIQNTIKDWMFSDDFAKDAKEFETNANLETESDVDPEMNGGMSGVNQIGENLNEEEMQRLQECLEVADDTVGLRSDILNDNKEDGVAANNPDNIGGCISIYDSAKEFETNDNFQTTGPEMNAGMSGVNQIGENLNEEERQHLEEFLQILGNLNEEEMQCLKEFLQSDILNDNKEDGVAVNNPASTEDCISIYDSAKEFETNANLDTETDVDNEMNVTDVVANANYVLLNSHATTEGWIFSDDFAKEFEANAYSKTGSALNDCVVQCASISCTNVNI